MLQREIKDIVISALVLALAFSIALSGGILGIGAIISNFVLALIAVSSAFIFHELGHRYVARMFGCYAEYRMWPQGLLMALVFSMFGFVFAAPGAVVIHTNLRPLTRKENGIISLTGPGMNIILAVIFLALNLVYASPIFSVGAFVNTWIAIFNLIPFPPLDGSKILSWDIRIWLAMIALAGTMFFIV